MNAFPNERQLRAVWLFLLGLLVVTVLVGSFDLGLLSLPIALAIAVVKALLILLFFMELRYSKRVVWVFAIAAYLWIAILIVGTLQDYLSRHWN